MHENPQSTGNTNKVLLDKRIRCLKLEESEGRANTTKKILLDGGKRRETIPRIDVCATVSMKNQESKSPIRVLSLKDRAIIEKN